jgi:hypothetical protein
MRLSVFISLVTIGVLFSISPANASRPENLSRGGNYDVTAFGARPDGAGDSQPGIQLAIDRACGKNITAGHPKVVLPTGIYSLSRPVLISCESLELAGIGSRAGTVLAPNYVGPSIIIEPQMTGVDPGPPLIAGNGHSFNTDGGKSVSLELRQDPYVELDGLKAFTVEAYFKQTRSAMESARGLATLVSSAGFISNNGGKVPGASFATTFAIGISPGQNPYAVITIAHTKYVLTANVPVYLQIVHHIALTYDGGAARLFLDGKLVASRAVSGPVTQTPFENVNIGPMANQWPGGDYRGASIAGFIDDVRLSNVARYTANFSPSKTALSPDSHTLILVPFDENVAGATRAADLRRRTVWLPVRRMAEPSGPPEHFIGDVNLHDFTMDHDGVFGWLATLGRYDHLRCKYCDYGLYFGGNSYESHFDDIYVLASNRPRIGRFGLYAETNNGGEYSNLTLDYSSFPLVINAGSGAYTNIFVGPDNNTTIYGILFEGSQASINRVYFDNESPSSAWIADILASNSWAPITIMGGEIDSPPQGPQTPHAIAPVIQDGGAPFIFIGSSFGFSQRYSCLAYVNKPPKAPIVTIGTTADPGVPLTVSPANSRQLGR